MPFTIHASKDGQRAETQRIRPGIAAAKARSLAVAGWDVYVTDPAGRPCSLEYLDDMTGDADRTLPLPACPVFSAAPDPEVGDRTGNILRALPRGYSHL
jgi:hypothetical protein